MITPIHVVPIGDLREHHTTEACWCSPERDEEYLGVFVHKSMDGRELFESGERKYS